MESKFKVGDRVVRASGSNFGNVKKGGVYTIKDKSGCEVSLEECDMYFYDGECFELYKEEPMKQFDMHTQPWFIHVNNEQEFNLLKEWLKENFGTTYYFGWHPNIKGLTNTKTEGKIFNNHVMWFNKDKILNQNSHEIKINFKTTIDSVEWPIVESEKDKKIRELKETIEAAAKQIKELEEM